MTSVFDDTPNVEEAYQRREVKPEHAYPSGPRSVKSLFKWMAVAMIIFMVAEAIMVLISFFLIWLYLPSTVVHFSYEQLVQIDVWFRGAGIFRIAMFLVCVILVSRVVYRTMRNLHTIASRRAEMAPGWAVGWYFVPIANLWKPAEGMSQIYHGTHEAVGEKSTANSPIPLWWTVWLVSNFAANISTRMSGGWNGEEYSVTSFSFDALSDVASLLSAYLLIRLFRRVVERQELLKHGGVATVFE